jgi:GNAT superfamily N-acetyltransferase
MLRECAVLFAGHYGVWGDGAPRATGTRVTQSVTRLRSGYLKDGDSFLTTHRLNGVLVGQALFRRFTVTTIEGDSQTPESGIWVTQLVIDALFRGRRIARALLKNCLAAATSGAVCCHLILTPSERLKPPLTARAIQLSFLESASPFSKQQILTMPRMLRRLAFKEISAFWTPSFSSTTRISNGCSRETLSVNGR